MFQNISSFPFTFINYTTNYATHKVCTTNFSFIRISYFLTLCLLMLDLYLGIKAEIKSEKNIIRNIINVYFVLLFQGCNVVPTDEGLVVTATTQWTESVQQAVAAVCGLKKNRYDYILRFKSIRFFSKLYRCMKHIL